MLEGIVRDSMTKHATNALRKQGYLIANIYGKGFENIAAAFKKNDFIKALKTKETLAFDIDLEGKTYKVVVQEYQKNPISQDLLHVDLMLVQPGVRTTYRVPVQTTGNAIGLKNKGLLMVHTKRVPVKAKFENLPEVFTLDITNLDVGDNILVRDLELPEDVKCYLDPRVPIVGIIKLK